MSYPVAYLRRSSADDSNPGDVSREAQEAAVRELAHRDGYNGDLRVFTDWDRSADEAKEARRTSFLAMLAAVERGEVSVVYAYALDRLYRSMRTFVRLTDAAKAHGVRIVTLREGVLGGDGSPMAQAFAQITAVFSELELNTAKARARSARDARRARGDVFGHPAFGFRHAKVDGKLVRVPDPDRPLAPVLDAYREAGTVLGAVRLLNARAVPGPKGGRWYTSALTRVLNENAPELLPPPTPTGRREAGDMALSKLLVCGYCGGLMAPNKVRRQYWCPRGHIDRASHPRYSVAEARIMPAIRAEADRLRPPVAVELSSEANEARQLALADKRARLVDAYVDGLLTKDERDRRLARIAAEEERLLVAARTLREVPQAIPWDAAPDAISEVLRAIFERIELGPDMQPARFVWRLPELRAA